jgi:hypothetical protein
MIIFDDRYIEKQDVEDLHNNVSNRNNWSQDPSNPLISYIPVEVNNEELSGDALYFIRKLDLFANSNRIDVQEVKEITLIKMDKKTDKQELEYESPEIDEEGNLILFISTNDSDGHTYVFNEGLGEAKSEDDLTVFTMFSPYAGRGFIVFADKFYALSMPEKFENQYMVKIKFAGKIIQNQASTVYDMEM